MFKLIIIITILIILATKLEKSIENQYNTENNIYNNYNEDNNIDNNTIYNNNNNNNNNNNTTNNNFDNSYYKKNYLLTQTELKFYNLLKETTDKLNLNLFTQVSMYELINSKNYSDFNRIKSKCMDFVITEKDSKIVCCIELDDKSHNTIKRQERDILINKIFQQSNIKLIRIPVKNNYNMEEIENIIKNNIVDVYHII